MGKTSRGKIQKESHDKPLLKDKLSEAEKITAKWSVFNKPPLHLLLIAIIGFLVYSNTFNVPFHFDDTNNIVENYKLKDLSNFWPPAGSRWFGFLTFALNYHFGGLDTFGYHIVNLTIHIINAILIYFLVVLTFKTPYFKVSVISASVSNQPNQFNRSTFKPLNYLPLFIALLFVSHPIQTQAVTYIVQRFTSLAAMFYLLSLVMYIKFRSQQSAISGQQKLHATRYTLYAVSLVSAILAMKTKEIAFTLPFIIILYEFCFFKSQNHELRTMNLRRLLYLLPFLLTLFIIPLSIVGIDKPVGDAIGELREAAQETEEISRWSYLFTQFRVIVTYIRLLFLPINQNLDYDYPVFHSFLNTEVFLSFLFLLSIFVLAVYLFYHSCYTIRSLQNFSSETQTPSIPTRYTLHPTPSHFKQVRGTRLIAFGIFWFFITLSVESSIIPIVDIIFEHRVYLPSVGIVIAFSTAVFLLLSRLTPHALRFSLTTVYLLLTTIVIAHSITTYQRNIVWQDGVSLWEDVVRKSPGKARGYNNLGNFYLKQSRINDAVREYQTALTLNPDYAEAHNNLGNIYYIQGHLDEAVQEYITALRLKPDFSDAHNNLGAAYEGKGLLDEAVKEYHTALRLNPEFKAARNNLNRILQIKR